MSKYQLMLILLVVQALVFLVDPCVATDLPRETQSLGVTRADHDPGNAALDRNRPTLDLPQDVLKVVGSRHVMPAEQLGAIGDDAADDTLALQSGLQRPGTVIVLKPGMIYRITHSLVLHSGTGIVGYGLIPGRIHMPASGFDCTFSAGCRHYDSDEHAVGLYFSGSATDGNRPVTDIILDHFAVFGDGHAQEGKTLMAVSCRNARDLHIEGLEIARLPNAIGIRCSGISGESWIDSNYIHDFYDDTASELPNLMSAISIDNDSSKSIYTKGLKIRHNIIERIAYGPRFVSRFDQQASGIVVIRGATELAASDNRIESTGQGLDWHGSNSLIDRNTVKFASLFCLKLIHGASRNTVTNNRLYGCGIGGISLGGGNNDETVEGNRIIGNTIENIDYQGRYSKAFSTAAFWLGRSSTSEHARNNYVGQNVVDPGHAKWIVCDLDKGNSGNLFKGLITLQRPESGMSFSFLPSAEDISIEVQPATPRSVR